MLTQKDPDPVEQGWTHFLESLRGCVHTTDIPLELALCPFMGQDHIRAAPEPAPLYTWDDPQGPEHHAPTLLWPHLLPSSHCFITQPRGQSLVLKPRTYRLPRSLPTSLNFCLETPFQRGPCRFSFTHLLQAYILSIFYLRSTSLTCHSSTDC